MSFISPASAYLAAVKARSEKEKFSNWMHELPENWIESFIVHGVKPFLEKHGYVLGYNDVYCIKFCKRWAFAHVQTVHKGTVDLVSCSHEGGEDEHEWYQDTISVLDWNEFAGKWTATEFLDSSDAGQKQTDDLGKFIWHCISLEGSPRHIEWLESLEEEEAADQPWIADDTQAYGGDRRTY